MKYYRHCRSVPNICPYGPQTSACVMGFRRPFASLARPICSGVRITRVRTWMGIKRHRTEEMVAKLRQVEVLVGQGKTQAGATAPARV